MKPTDIRAVKLHQAGRMLAPVLAKIYNKIGPDLTTMLLLYYAVRGIIMSKDLTETEKKVKLNKVHKDLNKAIKVLRKLNE